MAAGARAGERAGRGRSEGRPWGDPSPGWLFHAPRRGTSSERFGIFRASGRSGRQGGHGGQEAVQGAAPSKGARGHATRWVVLAVMAAMLTLFVSTRVPH